jgi:hypothetical protein
MLDEKRPQAFDRVPPGRYGWIFAMAVLTLVIGVGVSEVFWRAQGFQPSVTDTEALWAQERARVEEAGDKTLLILGRSRIQQAFVREVFQEVCPGYDTIQLAAGGDHPIATLIDIAEKTDFDGIVLCSITADSLLPELRDQQQHYLDYYHHGYGPLERLGQRFLTFAQWHLVTLAPEITPQEVLPDLLRRDVPPQFLRVTPWRRHVVDYRKAPLPQFAEDQLKIIQENTNRYIALDGYAQWPDGLARINDYVRIIQRRGGTVVFIRVPTSGDYYAVENQHFPRKKYWNVWANMTDAETIHFEDVPAMATLECAEGTHLHLEDTEVFTRALAEELKRRGLV